MSVLVFSNILMSCSGALSLIISLLFVIFSSFCSNCLSWFWCLSSLICASLLFVLALFSLLVGIFIVIPAFKPFFNSGLFATISSIDTLYFFEIAYNVSFFSTLCWINASLLEETLLSVISCFFSGFTFCFSSMIWS